MKKATVELTMATLMRCVMCQWYRIKEPEPDCGFFELPLVEVASPNCLNYEEDTFQCGTLP